MGQAGHLNTDPCFGMRFMDDRQMTWQHRSSTGGFVGELCSRDTGHEKMEWKAYLGSSESTCTGSSSIVFQSRLLDCTTACGANARIEALVKPIKERTNQHDK